MPADTENDFTNDNLDQYDLARRYRDAETHDLREALCSFVNPPCHPCDNLCVILASIRVKQCKVVAVCNLVRTIIISPAALGYWLPLQEILQTALCCRESSRGAELGALENLIKPFQTAGDKFFHGETPTTAKVSNTTNVPTQGAGIVRNPLMSNSILRPTFNEARFSTRTTWTRPSITRENSFGGTSVI